MDYTDYLDGTVYVGFGRQIISAVFGWLSKTEVECCGLVWFMITHALVLITNEKKGENKKRNYHILVLNKNTVTCFENMTRSSEYTSWILKNIGNVRKYHSYKCSVYYFDAKSFPVVTGVIDILMYFFTCEGIDFTKQEKYCYVIDTDKIHFNCSIFLRSLLDWSWLG